MTALDANILDVPLRLTFPIHTGKSLVLQEVSAILARSFARVVILAGDAESGKSTLLATLYEQFQRGAFGDFEFAGSMTLHGFEERIHDSRIASFRQRPTTPRTSHHDGVRFLHLRIRDPKRSIPTDLLISDLAGELFDDLRSSTAACHQFSAFRRADCFVSVVDGEALIDPQRRHRIAVQARDFVRGVLDAGVLPPSARVQLLLTKWDLVAASPEKGPAESIWDDLACQVNKRCNAVGVPFTALRTSARPGTSPDVPAAFGLTSLLQAWLPEQIARHAVATSQPSRATNAREIDRFGMLNTSMQVTNP